MKKYQETRQLPVQLTSEELLEKGQELARANVAALSAENVRKNTNAQLKADVDAKQAQVERLTSIVASREEVRPVPCVWRMSTPKPGKKSLIRLDTDQVVETRDMVGDDMQPELEPIVQEVGAQAGDPTVRDIGGTVIEVPRLGDGGEDGGGDPSASPSGDLDWSAVRAFYEDCRSIKATAEKFRLNANTLKARIRREGWGKR